jgi:hypothetical protein
LGQHENAWKSLSSSSDDESVMEVKVILGQYLNKDISDIIENCLKKV